MDSRNCQTLAASPAEPRASFYKLVDYIDLSCDGIREQKHLQNLRIYLYRYRSQHSTYCPNGGSAGT